jgi:hypothetical protein
VSYLLNRATSDTQQFVKALVNMTFLFASFIWARRNFRTIYEDEGS